MSSPFVIVAGVTGTVGQELLSILSDRDFPYSSVKMLASKRSARRCVAFDGHEYMVEELTVEKGTIVVENTSVFQMVEGVPLVIPEVNCEAMKGIKVGTGKGALIATIAGVFTNGGFNSPEWRKDDGGGGD